MPFTIIRQDITRMQVDAIVNAANTELAMGGGVCGAIFKAAGPARLQAACDKDAPIKTGEAAITPGFNLPAKFVITLIIFHAAPFTGLLALSSIKDLKEKVMAIFYMTTIGEFLLAQNGDSRPALTVKVITTVFIIIKHKL